MALEMNRVVVTGLGAICGPGHNVKEVWKNAIEGRSCISRVSYPDPEDLTIKIGGEIKNFELSPNILPPGEAVRYDRFIHLALAAGVEAFRHAGLGEKAGEQGDFYLSSRMGVILGVGLGGLRNVEYQYEILKSKGPKRVSPFLIPSIIPNMAAGMVSIELSLEGISYTVSSACASSNHALYQAFFEIQQGRQDVVISGGVESTMCHLPFAGFNNMKALSKRNDSPEQASRPFDVDRDGFVMGEGAGVLVLENATKAKERGATIYAELLSCGVSSDAHHIVNPRPDVKGAVACMNQAIAAGNVAKSDIDYVNAHGTSTPQGDVAETRALREVFGDHAEHLAVSSTKSMTGHLLGAAGGLESVFCVKAIESGIIPPTINLDRQDSECDLFYVPHKSIKKEIKYALNNSFGFGGANASVIFKRVK